MCACVWSICRAPVTPHQSQLLSERCDRWLETYVLGYNAACAKALAAALLGDVFTLSPASFDFSRTKTKDSRITFTQASSGTFVGADGLIKTTLKSTVLSEQINYWTKYFGATVTSNSIAAPDGTVTADLSLSAQQYSQIVKPVNVQLAQLILFLFMQISNRKDIISKIFNITIDFTLATEWKRFTNTFTTNSTTTTENVLFTKRPGSTNRFIFGACR